MRALCQCEPMHEGSRRAIIAAFLANLGIAVSKFVGFAITGSASLLAEAIHSLADTGNQALLFLGGARAKRAATPEHPFGYGRERFFWAIPYQGRNIWGATAGMVVNLSELLWGPQ